MHIDSPLPVAWYPEVSEAFTPPFFVGDNMFVIEATLFHFPATSLSALVPAKCRSLGERNFGVYGCLRVFMGCNMGGCSEGAWTISKLGLEKCGACTSYDRNTLLVSGHESFL